MASAAGVRCGAPASVDAHDVGNVLDAAEAAARAPLKRASRHAGVRQRLLVDGDVDRVTILHRHGDHAQDIGTVGNDAFGKREADAEIGKVGGGRHHHRVGYGVDQHCDRHLLGELPGDRRPLAARVD